MSIIRNYQATKWLLILYPLPLLVLLLWFLIDMWNSQTLYVVVTRSLLAVLVAGGFYVLCDKLLDSQEAVIRFYNAKTALINGHIAIVTNTDDGVRRIADAVSDYLSRLGIDHLCSDKYVRHVAVKTPYSMYKMSIDDIPPDIPEKCKLILVIIPVGWEQSGGVYIGYCLFDRGGKSVLNTSYNNKWRTVYWGGSKMPPAQVARQIVGGIFTYLNLIVRAATAPNS